MDQQVLQLLTTEARQRNILRVDPSFTTQVDRYINKHFGGANTKQRVVIETYISRAALHIAATEGKSVLEADDGKAAVWLYHQPDGVNQECAEAGNFALQQEAKRQAGTQSYIIGSVNKGLLTENFARHLDAR